MHSELIMHISAHSASGAGSSSLAVCRRPETQWWQRRGYACGVLKRGSRLPGGVYDARLEQIRLNRSSGRRNRGWLCFQAPLITTGRPPAFPASPGGDSMALSIDGSPLLVALELGDEFLKLGPGAQQSDSAAGDDALFYRCPRGVERILDS